MTPLFLDPSVLLLAVGGDHPWRAPCRVVLAAAAAGTVRIHLSVEGGQEFLFHRLRRVGREQGLAEFDQVDRLVVWHDFDVEILRAASGLVSRGQARGRDAVHAATALASGFTQIVSCDGDFDDIPGLERLDPVAGRVTG
ncbi:MAG: type II toxin-antitoxin system VapC family toxin [Tetrasphaera sp.]|nr:type II toxin-antitoxin system VapC family toxin [Tetrasphaera sp.]